jgi:hypothetical protein
MRPKPRRRHRSRWPGESRGEELRAAQSGAASLARASAARAHRPSGAWGLSVLRRWRVAQDWRGRDRDPGADPAPVEGDPARAREVLLPLSREDHAAAGPRIRSRTGAPGLRCSRTSCSPNTAYICRSTARAPPVRAKALISMSDARRLGGRGSRNPDAVGDPNPDPCLRGPAHHADDTTVPVLAKGKTRTGRLWTYVRDDRPFAGPESAKASFGATRAF